MVTRRDIIIGAVPLVLATGGITGAMMSGGVHEEAPAAPNVPQPQPLWFAGDSLAVGMATAAGKPSVAQVGTRATHVTRITRQMDGVPEGSTVILSLGMNDAATGYVPTLQNIGDLIVAFGKRHIIWVGPPAVVGKVPLLHRVIEVDATLSERVNGWSGEHAPMYVSTLGFDVRPWARDKAGIHFTAKGYAALWDYVRSLLPGRLVDQSLTLIG